MENCKPPRLDGRTGNEKMKKENNSWDDCICGVDRTVHTPECKRNHRNNYHYEYAKKRRKERVKNKCCASCGKKVEPIIPYRCKECQDKIRDYHKRIKENKK